MRSEGEEGVDWAERRRNIWFKGPMVGVGKVSGQDARRQAVRWLGWKQSRE